MRIAAVYLSHFFTDADVRRYPHLRGFPLVVGAEEPPKRVMDCSPEASSRGVQVGMPVRQAISRCSDVVVLTPDTGYYADLWRSALDALETISPEVEDARPGVAYLNILGLESHYGDEQSLAEMVRRQIADSTALSAAVGIATNKSVALAAASTANPLRIIPSGQEAEFLSAMPVSALSIPTEILDRLHLLGLERINQVAVLPLPAMVEQFGRKGARLWELANGIDNEPLRPRKAVPVLEETVAFDGAVASIEVLVTAARQLVRRLVTQLDGRAARELLLRADLGTGRGWEKRIVLREAVTEQERLYFNVKTALREKPPTGAVLNLGLRLSGLTGGTGRQLGLGEKRWLDALDESVRQLKARFDYSPIYRFVEVEPWSALPEDRSALIEYDA
jgi:nucleotidyltransferase/DNA polymerase involved in DNA repair